MKKFLLEIIKRLMAIPASFILRKHQPKIIIGVTGSVGKTTTKEAIFFVLEKKFGNRVGKSEGNLNTRLGIPLVILGFVKNPAVWLWPAVVIYSFVKAPFVRRLPEILVLEYAIDYPGEFKILIKLIRPKIAVITRIGPAHLEFFNNIESIYKEKSELVKALPKDGWAVLNEKDKLVKKMAKETKTKVIYYDGESPIDQAKEAAKKVGKILGISEEESQRILSDFKMPDRRLQIFKGIKNTKIIDDTYNANPISMEIALDYLKNLSGKRKVAFLGDMLELGKDTAEFHRKIGEFAREKVDFLIGVGELARNFQADKFFPDSEKAGKQALKIIKDGDIILVKGSRGMKMEKIVAAIRGK